MKRFLLLILAAATLLPSCIEKTYPVIERTVIREEPGSYVKTGYVDVLPKNWEWNNEWGYFEASISMPDVITEDVFDHALIKVYRVYPDLAELPEFEYELPILYPDIHEIDTIDGPVSVNYFWYLEYNVGYDGVIIFRYTHNDFRYPVGFNPGTMSFKVALVINAD